MQVTDRPLNKEERTRCWEVRDLYIKCLEEHWKEAIYRKDSKVNFSTPQTCSGLREAMDSKCPLSWIQHFEFKWGKETVSNNSISEFEDRSNNINK